MLNLEALQINKFGGFPGSNKGQIPIWVHTNCSLLPQRLRNLTRFSGGQHCPRGLLDPPRLSQCEVSWLDATSAAYLLSKVTDRLIFPPVVLIVAFKLLIGSETGGGQV